MGSAGCVRKQCPWQVGVVAWAVQHGQSFLHVRDLLCAPEFGDLLFEHQDGKLGHLELQSLVVYWH